MTAITFDTLKFAEKLTSVGFTSEQAKEDLRNLKDEIRNLREELKEDINKLKQKLFVHDWMLRFLLVFQVAILLKLFLA